MDAPDIPHLRDDPAAPQQVVFTHEQIRRVISGILLCIFLAAIDQTVVIPAVPAIAADLHGFGHLAWIVTAYLLTSTIATPIYGKLSDIYGRRALLLPAIVLFVFASILCGLAQSLVQLILARALQGVGGAGLMAMSQAAIADVVSPRERGRYQGYMAGAWAVASIAGPIIGGWVTDAASWRWIFWANLPIGIGAFLLSSRALAMLKVQRRETRIDHPGAALLAICTTASLLVLSWGGSDYAWQSPEILGLGFVAVMVLAALIWQERRAIEPLMPPRLFANIVFRRGVLIAMLNTGAMFGITFLLPLLFQLTRDADASLSGTLIVPFLAATCVGAFSGGQLGRRLGKLKRLLQTGLVVTVLACSLFAVMGTSVSLMWLMIVQFIIGVGIGLVQPCTLVSVQNSAQRHDVGAATGAFLFLRNMGGAVGSTITGVLLAGQFAASIAHAGLAGKVDLGMLRNAETTKMALDPVLLAGAHDALMTAFHVAFAGCAMMSALAFVATIGLPDVNLRTSN